MAKKWIAGAIKHPGALTAKAKAAGKSLAAFEAHPPEEHFDYDPAGDQSGEDPGDLPPQGSVQIGKCGKCDSSKCPGGEPSGHLRFLEGAAYGKRVCLAWPTRRDVL